MLSRNTILAFLIPFFAVFSVAVYFYQSRRALMDDLAKTGVVAIFDGGNVTHDDIREYFQYPPVSESPILRALELTPEDLSGLDKEDPEWLKKESGQLLLYRIIQHIALLKALNGKQEKPITPDIESEFTAYQKSIMIDELEKQFAERTPEISEADMMNYYVTHRERFHREGKRLARHLMLPMPSPDDLTETTSAIENIMNRLKQGESFRNLIVEDSKSESAASEGLLGWQPRGTFVRPFEASLWAMEIGEITGPIQIDNAIHFIQLLDVQPKGLMEFEDCKPQIQELLKESKQTEELFDLLKLDESVRQSAHPKETAAYRNAMLQIAYERQWDQRADIVKRTERFALYKKADAIFQTYVDSALEQTPKPNEPDNLWVIENATAKQLFRDIDFHFLIQLDVPDNDRTM